MRILIGMYLIIGLALAAVTSSVLGYWAVRTFLSLGDPRRSGRWETPLSIAIFSFLIAVLPLLAAYGLWKRWRWMRLVLLGISWWGLAGCAFAVVVASAMLAGMTDGRAFGIQEPPGVTLALAGGLATFSVFQLWVLMRQGTWEA